MIFDKVMSCNSLTAHTPPVYEHSGQKLIAIILILVTAVRYFGYASNLEFENQDGLNFFNVGPPKESVF